MSLIVYEILAVCMAFLSLVVYLKKWGSIFWLFSFIYVAIVEILVYTLRQPELRELIVLSPTFVVIDMCVNYAKEKKKKQNNQ